jgi:hypothetical protein
MSDTKCAPSKKYTDGSCFSEETLKKIANNYNKLNSDKININLPKKKLVNILTNKLSDVCSNNQICWLRQDIIQEIEDDKIKNDIYKNTFLPFGPKKKFEWLSTSHIDNVIDQYHSIYKDFLYLGTVPYDFEKLPILGLRNINFNKYLQQNKKQFGLVINLDKHDDDGSHWVGLYFNFDKNQIYFFDSVGKVPGKNIRKFITKIATQMYNNKYKTNIKSFKFKDKLLKLKNLSHHEMKSIIKENTELDNLYNGLDIRYNNVQHQFKNSECGVYSINFILRVVGGESFDDIINNPTSDDKMNEFRKLYFRNAL